MGCSQSTIGQESVSRCKERRLLMKQAVIAGASLSTSYPAYAAALMRSGFALNRYAHVAETVAMPEFSASERGVWKLGSISIPEDAAALVESVKAKETKRKRSVSKMDSDVNFEKSLKSRETKQKRRVSKDSAPTAKGDGVLKDSVRETKPKRSVSELYSFSLAKNDAVYENSLKAKEIKQKRRVLKLNSGSIPENDDEDLEITDEDDDLEFLTPDNASIEEFSDDSEVEDLKFRTPDNVSRREVSDDEEVEIPLPKPFVLPKTASDEIRKKDNVNVFKALREIADQFIKASECAQDVSRLLKPNRYRYPRYAADTRVTVDYAATVRRVIMWNQTGDAVNEAGDVYPKENEPLAIVLDTLLAWEKKLYVEMKAGELMKLEYLRKVILLTKQKRRGASSELLMKTKAAVRYLQTKYRINVQSIDSIVSEISNLRDHQLYQKLVELVEGMENMWKNVSTCHDNQVTMATNLKYVNISAVRRETTWDEQTTNFLCAVEEWLIQFEKLVANQKSYVNTLNIWLKLNLIPVRSNLKEKLSSSSKKPNLPIQSLLYSWHEYIEKLQDEPVKTAISSFLAVIKTIKLLQEETTKLKDKREETRREYLRKKQAFDDWLRKHNKRSARVDTGDGHGAGDSIMVDKVLVSEKRFVVESLKKRLDEETEVHRKHYLRVQTKMIWTLKTSLPELLKAMSDYGYTCAYTYSRLMCIAQSKNPANINSDPL